MDRYKVIMDNYNNLSKFSTATMNIGDMKDSDKVVFIIKDRMNYFECIAYCIKEDIVDELDMYCINSKCLTNLISSLKKLSIEVPEYIKELEERWKNEDRIRLLSRMR